jgi:hypothetical protein
MGDDDYGYDQYSSPQADRQQQHLEMLYSPTRQDNEDMKRYKLEYWKTRVREYLLKTGSFSFNLRDMMSVFEEGAGMIPDSFAELVKSNQQDFEPEKDQSSSIFQSPLRLASWTSLLTGQKSDDNTRYIFTPLLRETRKLVQEHAGALSEADRTLLTTDTPGVTRCFPGLLREIAKKTEIRNPVVSEFIGSLNPVASGFLDYLKKESLVVMSDDGEALKLLTKDDQIRTVDKRMCSVLKLKKAIAPLEERKLELEARSDSLVLDIRSYDVSDSV